MNLVDLVVILIAAAAAYRGWRRGLVGQIFELGGGFLGLVVGITLGPRIASAFTERAGITAALISLVAVFVFLSIGQTLGFLIGHRFGGFAEKARLGGVDSGLGSGFGIVVWLLSFWLIGSLLVNGPSRELARALKDSKILRLTTDVMPTPPDVLAYLSQYLSTSGFPQVFAGLPPSVGPPVDLPSNATARRAVQAAQDSTVRVVAPACGGVQLGSGWIAGESIVVTNAHVVAGADTVTIQQQGGSEVDGEVVLFDPETDLAIVRADGLTGPVLPLQVQTQDAGTPGATLGYPGSENGDLVSHRAAVQGSYPATGRDIYGRSEVTRDVYELRSPVRQGDSGGPFVLPSGEVAGVVFAASTTHKGTGYALTGSEVEDEIQQGSSRTEATSTGSCTR
ncbi:MAG TPA: MarP family serine protease [Actinomycetota bacterium]|nr:MarP family serine protease [Actinomycetota bacterium]